METAPHEIRCYACRTPNPSQTLVDTALPGMCPECRRKSRTIRERLAGRFGNRFGAVYFAQPGVDPPVLKARAQCAVCGMYGTLFGWTRWRSCVDKEESIVEGDAYAFCVSCESLHTDPWRPAAPSPTAALSGGYAAELPTLSGTSSFLVAELIGLFFVSIVILSLLI